jgi:hypothetical protein
MFGNATKDPNEIFAELGISGNSAFLPFISMLRKDVNNAAKELDREEARLLTRTYCWVQESRIRFGNKASAIARRNNAADEDEPQIGNAALLFMKGFFALGEERMQSILQKFVKNHQIGNYLLDHVTGIGPVLAASLIVEIDTAHCAYAGKVWSYAGLSPGKDKRLKGQLIKFNPSLKRTCFLVGESFIKQKGREGFNYGQIIQARKDNEWARNVRGHYAETAISKAPIFDENTLAFKWYSGQFSGKTHEIVNGINIIVGIPATTKNPGIPMLPPAHIHSRARRYGVKMFLSHFAQVRWEMETGTPMDPLWILGQANHRDYLPPPEWEVLGGPEKWGKGRTTTYERFLEDVRNFQL